MENRRILKPKKWNLLFKAQICAGLIGAVISEATFLFAKPLGGMGTLIVYSSTQMPSLYLCDTLGINWKALSDHHIVVIVAITNALILIILVTIIGVFMRILNSIANRINHEKD